MCFSSIVRAAQHFGAKGNHDADGIHKNFTISVKLRAPSLPLSFYVASAFSITMQSSFNVHNDATAISFAIHLRKEVAASEHVNEPPL